MVGFASAPPPHRPPRQPQWGGGGSPVSPKCAAVDAPAGRKGGGKGGGGGKKPKENADTLRSRQIARLVDVYSWGPTGGLVAGAKSIVFDGTRLENSDGSRNFDGVEWDERIGDSEQDPYPGFPGVEAEVVVGTQVTFDSPVTVTITDENLDAVRVKIRIPRLVSLTSGGNLVGAHAYYAIDLQPDGGAFTEVAAKQVIAKASSPTELEHRIELTGAAPWNIRVRRTNADSSSSTVENETWFSTYTKVIDVKLSRPNIASVFLKLSADAFGDRIVDRAYDVKGILIDVPANYDFASRTYLTTGPGTSGGVWDGSFKQEISDSAIWQAYFLLTNKEVGLGQFLGGLAPDKYSFYDAAVYSEQLVDDGAGGTEPRFLSNIWIASREPGVDLIRALLANCWASLAVAGDKIVVVQDRPTDHAALVAPADVVGGLISYQGSDLDERHSVAHVTWNNPANNWRPEIATYEDPELIARYGWRATDVTLLGCTRESQAIRHARWIIETEKAGPDTATYQGSFELIDAGPGEVVSIADDTVAGVRFGGRLAAATTTQLTLDATVTLEIGQTYTIDVVLPDKSVASRTVTNGPGAASVLDLDSPLAAAPLTGDGAGAMWVLRSDAVEPRQFRVISVVEAEPHLWTFTALQHDPDKYDRIFNNLKLPERATSTIPTGALKAPPAISVEEFLYESGVSVLSGAIIGWTRPSDPRVTAFEVEASPPDSDQFDLIQRLDAVTTTIQDIALGDWAFRVRSLDNLGNASAWTTAEVEIRGKLAPPADLTGFLVTVQGAIATAKWDQHPDLDVKVGGQIVLRYTPAVGSGAAWANATEVQGGRFAGISTGGQVPVLSGTFLAKALDSSGNYSTNAVKTEVASTGALNFNAVATQIENPNFAGAKVGVVVVDALGIGDDVLFDSIPDFDAVADLDLYSVAARNVLQLAGLGQFDDIPDFDAISDLDGWGGFAPAGSYFFADHVDAGALYESVRIVAEIEATAIAGGATIDNRAGTIDTWDSIDGTVAGASTVTLYISATDDDPAGSPSWGAWQLFVPGDYRGRAFRFRLDLATTLTDQNIQVSKLRVTVDMPDRIEAKKGLTTLTTAALRVSFDVPFFIAPANAVTPIAMAETERLVVSNEDETGFDVEILASGGSRLAREFNYVSKGAGARVV